MGASKCKDCGFDLESLPMQLPASRKSGGNPAVGLSLHCPMCGIEAKGVLADRGYFWRASEEKYRYWVEGHSSPRERRDLYSVPISERLELKFGKPAEPLGTLEICHIAVPCFLDGEAMQVPTLPVREEYLDCLDEDALRDARAGDPLAPGWRFGQLKRVDGRMVYVSEIPYRNHARERWRAAKPINLVSSGHVVNGVHVFPGVFVRHWPNVNNVRWRHHLVSFGANPDAVSFLRDHIWAVRALVPRLSEGAPRVELEGEQMRAVEVPAVKPGVRFATVSCEGKASDQKRDNNRPAWISISVDGRGGGLFSLPPAQPDEPQEPPLVFGLDFGTSNTVLAHRGTDGKTETVKPETGGASTTRRVIGRCTADDPMDLWPGAPWAGPHHDLLPSELMAARPWGEIAVRPDQIETMQIGVDLGVPLRLWSQGNIAPDGASQRILGDFKWDRAIRDRDQGAFAGLADRISLIQARFFEQAVLSATAWKLCTGRPYPNRVVVNYSYPPAFTSGDLGFLRKAAEIAETRLTSLLGLEGVGQGPKPVEFALGPDEAQAAVMGSHRDRMFTAFVDIGEGSLEVLVEDTFAVEKQYGHEGLQPEIVSNSVYFGGGVYLRALVRGEKNCVHSDYTTLAAQVRNFPNGRALLRAQSLFKAGRVEVARKRAAVYGQAVADYVARLLAGVCLEQGYQHTKEGGGERVLNLSRNRLFLQKNGRWQLGEDHGDGRRILFTLMLLGNGWNTVEVALREGMGFTLEEHFATLVRQRLQQILLAEKALASSIRDEHFSLDQIEFDIECPVIVGTGQDKVLHRKAVVASRLANPENAAAAPKDNRRSILGLEFNVAGRVVPWYRPWGAPQRLEPGDHPKRSPGTRVSPAAATTSTFPVPTNSAAASTPPGPPGPPARPVPPTLSTQSPCWYLGDADTPTGPLTLAQAVDRVLEGRDVAAAERIEVWREGMAEWARLDAVPELKLALDQKVAAARAAAAGSTRPPPRRAPAGPPPRKALQLKEWYLDEGRDETTGPWSADETVDRVCAGRGKAEALALLVWREGMGDWVTVDAVPALRQRVEARLA